MPTPSVSTWGTGILPGERGPAGSAAEVLGAPDATSPGQGQTTQVPGQVLLTLRQATWAGPVHGPWLLTWDHAVRGHPEGFPPAPRSLLSSLWEEAGGVLLITEK